MGEAASRLALGASAPVAAVTNADDPFAVFWSQAHLDDELSRGLLAGMV